VNKINKYVPAILWSALIFVLCFIPGSAIPQEDWLDTIYFDKIVHAGLYFVLYILLFLGLKNYNLRNIGLALLVCLVQGILIECLQGSIQILERSFDSWDIAANFVGSVTAIFFVKRHFERAV
jgi:VanZ family protein